MNEVNKKLTAMVQRIVRAAEYKVSILRHPNGELDIIKRPEEFGAVADGVTDNTYAIQMIINQTK